MTKKTWIKLKRGILDPKHRERIGIRIWLYLHILDRANWEEGAVLEWRDEAEAGELEMDLDTLRVQRRQLEVDGYIRCERRGHYQRVTVLKWVNPREYSGQVHNPPDVAGTDKEPSVQNRGLEENEATASLNPSGNSSCNQSLKFSGALPCTSQNQLSQIRENGGRSAAAPQNLWVSVLGQLQRQLRKSEFETWIRDTQVVSQTDGELVVGTGNSHAVAWLQDHAREPAEAALLEAREGRRMSVRFVVLEKVDAPVG
jgi:hypothetical protein